MPSPLQVVVARVRNVRPHPHADRLELADVCDHQVVLPRGKYAIGDLVVFFPVDVVLPEVWIERLGCGAFLHGSGKNRVGTAAIRGEKSFGLVVDIPQPHGADWREGRNVADYYGATKYEPPVKAVCGDIEAYDRTIDAFVEEYTHVRNGKLIRDVFLPGETVVATEKIHGANCKIGMVGDKVIAASMKHRRKRPRNADGTIALLGGKEMRNNTYWFPWTLRGCQELMREMRERFRVVLLYGEVFGGSVQNLDYGVPKGHGLSFRAFDLKLDGKFAGWSRLREICGKHGVPMVPELYRGPFDAEVIHALADGDSVVSKKPQIREGVVVRPLTEEWRGKPPERAILKYIGERHLADRHAGDDAFDM